MALASGSPEILLTVIETFETYGISTGQLGPSFIIGSSAFNLLIVVGIASVAVPSGVVKKINNLSVYLYTAVVTVLTYVWLYIVLKVWTEDQITVPEAILTFCFYFLFIIFAYAIDKIASWFSRIKSSDKKVTSELDPAEELRYFNQDEFKQMAEALKEETKTDSIHEEVKNKSAEYLEDEKKSDQMLDIQEETKTYKKKQNQTKQLESYLKRTFKVDQITDIDPVDLAKVLEPSSVVERLSYRQDVANKLANRRPFVIVKGSERKQTELKQTKNLKKEDLNPYIGFKWLHYSVIEGAGSVEVTIIKKTKDTLEVGIRTVDDTAVAPDDYHHKDEVLLFLKDEYEKKYKVDIVDDNEWEPNEDFYIELYNLNTSKKLKGLDSETRVTIIDDDSPGQFGFLANKLSTHSKDKVFNVEVVRKNGCSGKVKLNYEIREYSKQVPNKAKEGLDFIAKSDTLHFEHGETKKNIKVDIIAIKNEDPERDDIFEIRLFDIEPEGAKLSKKNTWTIHIVGSSELVYKVQDLEKTLLIMNRNDHKVSWLGQFRRAWLLHPQVDEEGNVYEVSGFDAFLHFISIGWKVILSIIPPSRIWFGIPTIWISLVLIGALAAFIRQASELFGCIIELKDPITAIIFVALGTSIQNLFTSIRAAYKSRYADSALAIIPICSWVNVFVGLGLSWIVAIIYYESKNKAYSVPASTLGLEALMFFIFAAVTYILLLLKRWITGGEIGGNMAIRWLVFAVMAIMWILFIIFSALRAYKV